MARRRWTSKFQAMNAETFVLGVEKQAGMNSGPIVAPTRTKMKSLDTSRLVSIQGWQREAYEFVSAIGELRYVQHQKAQIISRIKPRVRLLDAMGQPAPDPSSKPDDEHYDADQLRIFNAARNTMASLSGPRGSTREIMRRIELNVSIAGECYLVGIPTTAPGTNRSQVAWEVLSIDELVLTGGSIERRTRASGMAQKLPQDTYISRIHRPDALFADEADSEIKGVLRPCRSLITLEKMIDAAARSRIPAGLLFWPDTITSLKPNSQNAPSAVDVPLEDGEVLEQYAVQAADEDLMDLIWEHMTVMDENDGSTVVPLGITGPADAGEKIRFIDTGRDFGEWAQKARQEALERIGRGINSPPEVMMGMSGANDWTAANIDQNWIRYELIPEAEFILDFLAEVFLRRVLVLSGQLSETEAERVTLEPDASAILSRRDETENARNLHDRRKITDEALLRAHNLDPDRDGLSYGSEEFQRRIAEEMLVRSPYLIVALAPVLGLEVDLTQLPENLGGLRAKSSGAQPGILNPGRPEGDGARDPASKTDSPDVNTGDGGASAGPGRTNSRTASASPTAMIISGAAQEALQSGVDLAASRLIRLIRTRGSEALQTRAREVTKAECLLLPNKTDFIKLGCDQEGLFRSAWDNLRVEIESVMNENLPEEFFTDLFASLDIIAMGAFEGPVPYWTVSPELVDSILQNALAVSQ